MNAHNHGYGTVVPDPSYLSSQLGNVTYMSDGGHVHVIGSLLEDDHFKKLSNNQLYHTTETEAHPATIVAFSTGSIQIRPLAEAEYSTYVCTP